MKYLYALLGLVSLSSFSSQAQNWEPFPYDSVYFINEDNDMDILIPVVKSSNPDDLLLRMFTRWEQGFIKRSVTDLDLESYDALDSVGTHWFGDELNYSGGILSFETVFSDQIFTVDLQAEVGTIDSQSFTMDNNQFYLLVETESQSFDSSLNDSVKTITLTLTDSLFAPKTFSHNPVDTSDICTDVNMYDLGYTSLNKSIIVGKTTGIQTIPNLVFYPFCRSFTKYKTVDELQTIMQGYHLDVGDIIEGTYNHLTIGPPQGSLVSEFRREITGFTHDVINNSYNYNFEYTWKIDPNTIDETIIYEPNDHIVFDLASHEIYTGTHENGIGRMLRMNSKWGYPFFQMTSLQPFPAGGLVYGILGYMEYIHHGDVTLPTIPGEVSSGRDILECITYYNIGGVEFGEEGTLSIPEPEDIDAFQVAFNNGVLKFNTAIKGQVHVYDVNGKRIADYALGEETDMLKFPEHINKGVYIIRFEDINEVVKVVY